MRTMDTNTLNSKHAAELLGISYRTMQTWLKQGVFPHAYKLHPGNQHTSPYRIPCEDVDKILSERNPSNLQPAA